MMFVGYSFRNSLRITLSARRSWRRRDLSFLPSAFLRCSERLPFEERCLYSWLLALWGKGMSLS